MRFYEALPILKDLLRFRVRPTDPLIRENSGQFASGLAQVLEIASPFPRISGIKSRPRHVQNQRLVVMGHDEPFFVCRQRPAITGSPAV